MLIAVVNVIVISEFLERHSKAKRIRAPACSGALRRIKWVVRRAGHILSRIYNCTIHGNRPIDNATSAHLHCTFGFYNCTSCDQLHVKICPVEG